MSRPANCLELFRAVVQVSDEDVLQVPDLVIEPGEVVTVEACYEAATRLVDFLAGRGRGLLDRGWVDLDGHPLLALAPEERLRHGLHAPPLRPDSLRDIGALERLLAPLGLAGGA